MLQSKNKNKQKRDWVEHDPKAADQTNRVSLNAFGEIRTLKGRPTGTSNLRVYQFRHESQLNPFFSGQTKMQNDCQVNFDVTYDNPQLDGIHAALTKFVSEVGKDLDACLFINGKPYELSFRLNESLLSELQSPYSSKEPAIAAQESLS